MPIQSPVLKRFDYDSLDTADAVFVQQQTGAILSLMRRSAEDIIEIGQRLIEVKKKLGHGRFGAWLDTEFKWSEPTAQRYMRVAQQFKSVKLTDLNIAPSALYVVASPSIPEAAKTEVIARAQSGESITYTAAKQIKQKYTSPSFRSQPQPAQPPITKTKPQNLQLETIQLEPSTQSEPQNPQLEASVSKQDVKSEVTEPDAGSKVEGMGAALATSAPRQRAIEPASPKPEILAIRPKAAPELEEVVERFETRSEPVEMAVGFVQPNSWWKLGEEHLLYCGEPTSPRFQERLPEKVALSLAFPSTKNWQFNHLSNSATTVLALYTPYLQDQDYQLFQTTLRGLLMLYTEGGDAVVFSFLPELDMPLLALELGCRSFSVDPDPVRCASVVTAWQERGLRAEKVSGLRF